MSGGDCYPDFDFDFRKIREYWKGTLGNYEAVREYLRIVGKRLKYRLQELGSWIDFEVAAKHLQEDLHLRNAEAYLEWKALNHRVHLANVQRRQLSAVDRKGGEEVRVEVKRSSDGKHDAVWHEGFRAIYKKAMAREWKELRRLRDTGRLSSAEKEEKSGKAKDEGVRILVRPRLQWVWANRLLAYLLETLREQGAICDDGEMWAALDGVFRDRNGEAITRKDLAVWAHQYRNNKSCGDGTGKPKKHELVDQIIEKIQGKSKPALNRLSFSPPRIC